ncbi:MAG: DUF1501 domain-containing protein [Cyclobacteriaceae bacterium]|nr:DUF1501 domain-containing protein [Cyclobacteriaceae bacterium]
MRRRGFLKKLPLAAGSSFMLNSLPLSALAQAAPLHRLAASSNNDRVLILIQLHGGNDGLNTVIPIEQYAEYYNLRPNLAIPDKGKRKYIDLDSSLSAADQAGLHPDLTHMKALYDQGKMNIVQNVAYENVNGSHFRSRDIWFMGGDYNEYLPSGWMGRYLDHEYPGYPDSYPNDQMPDPLAIEIGNGVSLAFHRNNGIPTAISIQNPEQFYDLVSSVGGLPPESIANTHYGEELRWIMDIEEKSNQFAGRLKEVYEKGSNSQDVEYPDLYPFNAPPGRIKNRLAPQLKMIARLLSGGVKTKIFLARLGGFDTHAEQVESYDATMGTHAALLYHISSAMKAFQDDLKGLGLEDRVMSMTFSEFGRRAFSNGSYGSDHGTAAPMFVFGKMVQPGVTGTNPDLNNLNRGNLIHQFDYRQVFTSAVVDWLQADAEAVEATLLSDWVDSRLPIVGNGITGTNEGFFAQRNFLDDCYPNPVADKTVFAFRMNTDGKVKIELLDVQGRSVATVLDEFRKAGLHHITYNLQHLKSGTYLYRLENGALTQSKKLVKL